MSIRNVLQMSLPVAAGLSLALLLAWSTGSLAASGVVTAVEGESTLVRDEGVFSLQPGVDVDEGDLVKTGADGRVQLEMEDGSLLEVGNESDLYLSDYVLDHEARVENAAVSLLKGWLRFVAAKVAASGRYEFNTPVASIGIRGTEGIIVADEESSSVLLEEGRIEVFEVDEAGETGASQFVEAGQLVRRQKARRIIRENPEAFRALLPAFFKERPKRLKKFLKRRGVTPKKLREMGYDDIRGLLKSNPRIKKRLKKHFERKLHDPEFRRRLKQHIKDHPEWERELKRQRKKQKKKRRKKKVDSAKLDRGRAASRKTSKAIRKHRKVKRKTGRSG